MNRPVKTIGHRGAAGLVPPGNTMASFGRAVGLGVDFIEFDVRRTSDDRLVCHHDPEIGGLTLSSLPFSDARERTADLGYSLPLLTEVLEEFRGRTLFDIEIKETGYEPRIWAEIGTLLPDPGQYIVKSFEDPAVAWFAHNTPARAGLLLGREKPRSALLTRGTEIFPELRIARCGAAFVSPHFRLLQLGFVPRMHALKKDVYVWTVNDPAVMRDLIRNGVDGLISDRPDLALVEVGR